MTATTFCDSAGITTLIRANKQAAAHGAELRLLLPCPNVLRVLEIQGVDAVLPIYHSLEEALDRQVPAAPPQQAPHHTGPHAHPHRQTRHTGPGG